MSTDILAARIALLHQAGFPPAERSAPQTGLPIVDQPKVGDQPKCARCLALIATRNFLPYARLAAESFRRYHPDFRAYLLLVDGRPDDAAQFPDGTLVFLPELQVPHLGWYATKYNGSEFCNSLKPALLRYLAKFAETVIYLDSDIVAFSRFDEIIAALTTHNLVLIPHSFTPFPRPEQFHVHPTRADIFNSGLINAGCFGMQLAPCVDFLDFWLEANLAPGSFLVEAGYQTDQHYLNWALVSLPHVHILHEPRYNVAYWNLHERDLWVDPDDESPSRFRVSAKPLAFFHFSGYDVEERLRISRHDHRISVYNMPAVAELLSWYSDQIQISPVAYLSLEKYRLDILPNGLEVTPFLRGLLKRYEVYFPKFDGFTRDGADCLAAFLMEPLPATGSVLPLVAAEIYDRREDLRSAYPGAHIGASLAGFWRWFCRHAGLEFGVQLLIDRFRKSLVSDSVVGFTSQLVELIGNDLQFMGEQRGLAAERLRSIGRRDLSDSLLECQTEWCFFTSVGAVLEIYRRRVDLQAAMPDVFEADHDAFVEWVRCHATAEHGLPAAAAEDFAARCSQTSLARVYSYLSRRGDLENLCRHHLLADHVEPLIRDLIRGAGEGLEYDLNDVVILSYLHETQRQSLVPLYLELPFIRRMAHASRLPADSLKLLPADVRGATWAKRGCELHAALFDRFDAHLDIEMKQVSNEVSASFADVFKLLSARGGGLGSPGPLETAYRKVAHRVPARAVSEPDVMARLRSRQARPGVNVFGYFYSDIGIGESSRGLARAVERYRPVNKVPYHTAQLQCGTKLSDMFQRYDYLSDTNVFVSYPHQREDLLGMLPREQRNGRRNVAHLAWEQKDGNPWWKVVYDRYDAIWVISEFAATPFRKMFPDRVTVVPNVLNFEQFPSFEGLERSRLRGEQLNFLFVFDANSSIERKNPEGVIAAFIKAFSGTPNARRVVLTLKIGGLHRPEHAARIERLMRLAHVPDLTIRFDGRQLTRAELLRLIAESDCYVSLHRAEGFGYTMAEAMYYGVPVIASGYSGNLEYMTEKNSFLVPTREVFVNAGDGPFQRGSVWGDPSVDAAAALMRRVAEYPAVAIATGERGRASVRSTLSASAVGERIGPYLS